MFRVTFCGPLRKSCGKPGGSTGLAWHLRFIARASAASAISMLLSKSSSRGVIRRRVGRSGLSIWVVSATSSSSSRQFSSEDSTAKSPSLRLLPFLVLFFVFLSVLFFLRGFALLSRLFPAGFLRTGCSSESTGGLLLHHYLQVHWAQTKKLVPVQHRPSSCPSWSLSSHLSPCLLFSYVWYLCQLCSYHLCPSSSSSSFLSHPGSCQNQTGIPKTSALHAEGQNILGTTDGEAESSTTKGQGNRTTTCYYPAKNR